MQGELLANQAWLAATGLGFFPRMRPVPRRGGVAQPLKMAGPTVEPATCGDLEW
jgi:hypothetical protein